MWPMQRMWEESHGFYPGIFAWTGRMQGVCNCQFKVSFYWKEKKEVIERHTISHRNFQDFFSEL
jgi:hypothetical protein